jgi:hypothetical protein
MDGLAKMMFGSSASTSAAAQAREAARQMEESNAEQLIFAVDSLAMKIDYIFSASVRVRAPFAGGRGSGPSR